MPANRPHLIFEPDHACTNFHGNVHFTPARYCDVWNFWDDNTTPQIHRWLPGLLAIQEIIRDAEKRNQPVRAMGAGWSLSDATVTSGCLLNTKPLNVIEVGVHPENCQEEYLSSEKSNGQFKPSDLLVFAQCGATIAELNQELESRGLALPTSGASNGQTICGAISTGTHGAAWNFGGMQEFIVGIHLIGQGGKSDWIERQSRPVMTHDFCKLLSAERVRDDLLFNAALVSFGSFGVIHAVMLKAEPLYLLEEHVQPRHYDQVLSAMLDIENGAAMLGLTDVYGNVTKSAPYHFEILLNPFAFEITSSGIREKSDQTAAYVRCMYKRPPDLNTYSPIGRLLGSAPKTQSINTTQTISTDAFSFLEKLADLAPLYAHSAMTNDMSKQIIEGMLQPDNPPSQCGTILTPGGIFGATPLTGQGLSCELGFDRRDLAKAIEIIMKEILAFPLVTVPSLRFIAASQASLAPTPFAPYTCMIELPAALSDRTLSAYQNIWSALEANGVSHTFHWGQCLKWGASPIDARMRMEKVYGQRLHDWLTARKSFLDATSRQILFSNPMVSDCGFLD